MSANYKKLGDYIQPIDIRNSDLKVSHLLGLSIENVLSNLLQIQSEQILDHTKLSKKDSLPMAQLLLAMVIKLQLRF